MFDTEDWNVDGEAVHLASSLFDPVTPTHPGKKKKKSKHSDPNLTNTSDKKSPLKRKLFDESSRSMKKKNKKRSDERNKEDAPAEVESGKQNLHHDCVSGSKKKKLLISPIKAGALSSEENITKKKKKKQKVPTSQENVPKPDPSDNSQHDKKKKLKRKKIRGEIEKDDESPSKKLKVQETQGQDESRVEGDTTLTRKQRRHKHKKKTSKKNKYKHLADARKNSDGTDGSTGSIPAASQDPVVKGQFVLLRKNTGDSEETLPNSEQSLDKKKKKKRKKNVKLSDHPSQEVKNNSVNENVSIFNQSRTDFERSSDKKKQKINSKSESDVSLMITKLKTPKKHSYDLEKLKEILSSNEKQSVKKTNSGNGQKEKKKSFEYTGTPVNKKKGITDSISNDSSDTANSPSKVKSPTKHNFDVKKLKEIMSSEKKKMDTLKQDIEKKEKRRDRNRRKSLTDKMHERLAAARFRYLNEQLYTTTGNEAAQLFADDEEAFHVYHEGYSSQVSKWPIDPLDVIIKEINARHKTPKTVIADLGCGSARLAQSMSGVKVHSFDLVSVNKRVTACDMSKVPLDTGCVDVAVFCLSLMGTNLTDYLLEANRILKEGGVMMIAEVESRFQKVGAFISEVEKLGFEIVSKDTSNKMFYMFHFKKVRGMKETPLNLSIELNPCIYKKR
ncbi:ribosomal RNA-processing protein 8-like [Haliotis rubra]|uniref:ribosomal RNA-processing protein 8-like n=1 Tax=Haliotis rubra TaxID=36100 RepID=UPI001EE5B17E|nr:ribosomal RNA-processing protein 8-like [Haliotis rubra]XP_046575062.1 ribosomal RNA-processing protein 8-like [Haliotis rubra]